MKFFAAVAIALLVALPAVRAQDNPDDFGFASVNN